MAKHFIDSISLRIFNMADMHWVMACTSDHECSIHTSEWNMLLALCVCLNLCSCDQRQLMRRDWARGLMVDWYRPMSECRQCARHSRSHLPRPALTVSWLNTHSTALSATYTYLHHVSACQFVVLTRDAPMRHWFQ